MLKEYKLAENFYVVLDPAKLQEFYKALINAVIEATESVGGTCGGFFDLGEGENVEENK